MCPHFARFGVVHLARRGRDATSPAPVRTGAEAEKYHNTKTMTNITQGQFHEDFGTAVGPAHDRYPEDLNVKTIGTPGIWRFGTFGTPGNSACPGDSTNKVSPLNYYFTEIYRKSTMSRPNILFIVRLGVETTTNRVGTSEIDSREVVAGQTRVFPLGCNRSFGTIKNKDLRHFMTPGVSPCLLSIFGLGVHRCPLFVLELLNRRPFMIRRNVGIPKRSLEIPMPHPLLHRPWIDTLHQSVRAEGVSQLV